MSETSKRTAAEEALTLAMWPERTAPTTQIANECRIAIKSMSARMSPADVQRCRRDTERRFAKATWHEPGHAPAPARLDCDFDFGASLERMAVASGQVAVGTVVLQASLVRFLSPARAAAHLESPHAEIREAAFHAVSAT